LCVRPPRSQKIYDEFNRNSCALHKGFSRQNARVNGDPILSGHSFTIPEPWAQTGVSKCSGKLLDWASTIVEVQEEV
jgi:hypothetical protein